MLAGVAVVFSVYLVLEFFTDRAIKFIAFEAAGATVAGSHEGRGLVGIKSFLDA
jgi:hypothetical protein